MKTEVEVTAERDRQLIDEIIAANLHLASALMEFSKPLGNIMQSATIIAEVQAAVNKVGELDDQAKLRIEVSAGLHGLNRADRIMQAAFIVAVVAHDDEQGTSENAAASQGN